MLDIIVVYGTASASDSSRQKEKSMMAFCVCNNCDDTVGMHDGSLGTGIRTDCGGLFLDMILLYSDPKVV